MRSASQQTDYDLVIKLVLVGDSGVGKTCLAFRFAENTFRDDFISTMGVDFKLRSLEVHGRRIKVQLWDTAGQEKYSTITSAYYRDAQAILFCFDVTQRRTFSNVEQWLRAGDQASGICLKALVGCKIDIRREVSHNEGCAFALQHHLTYYETSSRANQGVEELFMAVAMELYDKLSRSPAPTPVPVPPDPGPAPRPPPPPPLIENVFTCSLLSHRHLYPCQLTITPYNITSKRTDKWFGRERVVPWSDVLAVIEDQRRGDLIQLLISPGIFPSSMLLIHASARASQMKQLFRSYAMSRLEVGSPDGKEFVERYKQILTRREPTSLFELPVIIEQGWQVALNANGRLLQSNGNHTSSVLGSLLLFDARITSLDVSSNRLTDIDLSNLLVGLCSHPSINRLFLKSNNFGSRACNLLANWLVENRSLQMLDLSFNAVASHLNLLFFALRRNCSLQELHLSRTGITSSMIHSLIQPLLAPGSSCKLKQLVLEHNAIDSAACSLLMRLRADKNITIYIDDLKTAAAMVTELRSEPQSGHASLATDLRGCQDFATAVALLEKVDRVPNTDFLWLECRFLDAFERFCENYGAALRFETSFPRVLWTLAGVLAQTTLANHVVHRQLLRITFILLGRDTLPRIDDPVLAMIRLQFLSKFVCLWPHFRNHTEDMERIYEFAKTSPEFSGSPHWDEFLVELFPRTKDVAIKNAIAAQLAASAEDPKRRDFIQHRNGYSSLLEWASDDSDANLYLAQKRVQFLVRLGRKELGLLPFVIALVRLSANARYSEAILEAGGLKVLQDHSFFHELRSERDLSSLRPKPTLSPGSVQVDFSECNRIGSGSYGQVYRGLFTKPEDGTTISVAIKRLTTEEAAQLRRELPCMQLLRHRNIIRYHGFYGKDNLAHLVLDLAPRGSLIDYLITAPHEQPARGMLPPDRVRSVAAGICEGCSFLHKHGVVHRDLKPHNVLVGSDFAPLLCDFSVMRVETQATATVSTGTFLYAAPELSMRVTKILKTSSDIFALGYLLYELYFGIALQEHIKRLLKTTTDGRELDAEWARWLNERKNRDLPPLDFLPSCQWTRLFELCFQWKPELRPSATELTELVLSVSPSGTSLSPASAPPPQQIAPMSSARPDTVPSPRAAPPSRPPIISVVEQRSMSNPAMPTSAADKDTDKASSSIFNSLANAHFPQPVRATTLPVLNSFSTALRDARDILLKNISLPDSHFTAPLTEPLRKVLLIQGDRRSQELRKILATYGFDESGSFGMAVENNQREKLLNAIETLLEE